MLDGCQTSDFSQIAYCWAQAKLSNVYKGAVSNVSAYGARR